MLLSFAVAQIVPSTPMATSAHFPYLAPGMVKKGSADDYSVKPLLSIKYE